MFFLVRHFHGNCLQPRLMRIELQSFAILQQSGFREIDVSPPVCENIPFLGLIDMLMKS